MLYQFGFNNYSIKTLLDTNDFVTNIEIKNATKETRNLDLIANHPIHALMENSIDTKNLSSEITWKENIHAPIEQGDILGSISYTVDGIAYQTDLIASHFVEDSKFLNWVLKIGFGILIVILAYILVFHKKRRK